MIRSFFAPSLSRSLGSLLLWRASFVALTRESSRANKCQYSSQQYASQSGHTQHSSHMHNNTLASSTAVWWTFMTFQKAFFWSIWHMPQLVLAILIKLEYMHITSYQSSTSLQCTLIEQRMAQWLAARKLLARVRQDDRTIQMVIILRSYQLVGVIIMNERKNRHRMPTSAFSVPANLKGSTRANQL